MTLDRPAKTIKLPSPQETQFQWEINTRASKLFDSCRKLVPVTVFQWEERYPKEWKIGGKTYRVTRQSNRRCKFEFPHDDQLSVFTTLHDGSGIEAHLATRDVTKSTLFTTDAWSQTELLPRREKIEAAFSIAEAALAEIEQFAQSEVAHQADKTGGKVAAVLS